MILVADDNVAVRNLLYDSLTYFGYKVILAVDGQDAVDKFVEHGENTRLVLLDVIMPIKNGIKSCQEIKQIRPDVKVLLLSGYAADVIKDSNDIVNGVELIKKPFSPTDLMVKIREMLDEGAMGGETLTL
jgi:DNA-binding response OmpR family regulator